MSLQSTSQRNSSQLVQHAIRFNGLRRSLTTKVKSTSPPIQQQPRTSTSTTVSSMPSSQQQDTCSQRVLSPIPENKQQAIFKMTTIISKQQHNYYYRAFLSSIAYEFKRIILSDRIKNDIEYHNVFDGKEAVDKLKEVLGTHDRARALRVGRALEAQRFFHDVNYENRLIDDIIEIYQFNELLFHHSSIGSNNSSNSNSNNSSSSNSSHTSSTVIMSDYDGEEDDDGTSAVITTPLPNGIYVELTHCYTPTCASNNLYPCYSYTCPKRERLRNRPHSVDTREKRVTAYIYEVEKYQPLWSQTIDNYIVLSTPPLERKRQETIFELIYTEENFLTDLDYVVKMWIEPLKQSDIIPKHRRDEFIQQVFSNLIEIRNISQALTIALRARQQEHPIVSHICDIMKCYVNEFEPFVYYGKRQHQGKHVYEHERYNNPRFALFAEKTERDVSSRKLELNGYLTKPTTRLGRYTLLLDKIHSRTTTPNHPDKENIPFIINTIKQLLQRVNLAAGQAKNRFDLEQINRHLSFKNKRHVMDLKLLQEKRSIIKQGTIRKTCNLDSTEYQVILFDHYLVIAKVKMLNAVEHYCIQKRPIPIELLGVTLPAVEQPRKTSSSSPTEKTIANKISPDNQQLNNAIKLGAPITFYHQGSNLHDTCTLFAPSEQNRKSWNTMIQKQREIKFKRRPVFDIVDTVKRYEFSTELTVHHMVTFDDDMSYMLATDAGIYVGPYSSSSDDAIPRKILHLEKAHQVHILQEYQLLLILADNVLWQYPLDITINGRPDDNQSIQNFGRKIRNNVPFFHVGTCLDQILICVPKMQPSVNGTEIDLYEPTMPKTELKKKSLLGRLSSIKSSAVYLSLTNTQVTHLKPIYSPCDVWAIDNTKSMLLLTTPLGIIAVDMKTKKADALLDPSDKHLTFITKHEKIDKQITINPVIKHISVFQVPNGNYLMCYDKFAFYIDKKGKRSLPKFKIEWEGNPTAFAYHYPHVIAFEQQFIEIRSVLDGHLQQVIQGKNVCCLQNGHKSKESFILGTMLDKTNSLYQHLFQLEPIINHHHAGSE